MMMPRKGGESREKVEEEGDEGGKLEKRKFLGKNCAEVYP